MKGFVILLVSCFALAECGLSSLLHLTKLQLYTQSNRDVGQDLETASSIAKTLPVKVLVHGFKDTNSKWSLEMKNAILAKENVNVVIVNWKSPTGIMITYLVEAHHTETVGDDISKVLVNKFGRANIHCIGHSLGAHICGFAGSFYKKAGYLFDRISGLDPAGPHFHDKDISKRLDASDAAFVDVYHTNQGLKFIDTGKLRFGYQGTLGHVDFILNNGFAQTGCPHYDVSAMLGDAGYDKINDNIIGCSHSRAHKYYLESIRNPTCYARSPVTFGYAANKARLGEFKVDTVVSNTLCTQ